MLHSCNDARRGKFEAAWYRLTNFPEYNKSHRYCGNLTVWVSEEVVRKWSLPRPKTSGGQAFYSDLAIEICLTLRIVFRRALRQTQGFMRSIAKLVGLDLEASTFLADQRPF